MKILIVDDSSTNLKLLSAQLEAEQITVLQATNGVEALDILERERVDVIISDILMPKMDGYTLCQNVRSQERFDFLIFVFYSATYASSSDEQFALGLGADAFLKKPSPVETILEHVRSLRESTSHSVRPRTDVSDVSVLREYNDRLVTKLEEKNIELLQRTEELEHEIAERRHEEEQRHQLEKQLVQAQKLESLGTLASGIAHDFNNILGIIIGHASLLEKLPPNSDNIQRNAGAITKAGQRGAALVKQMLTFARKTDIMFESLTINDVVEEVASLVKETFPKTIDLSMNLETDLPSIEADATQLHQVLLNLCVNARDAMPGGGTLTICTHHSSGKKLSHSFPEATAMEYVGLTLSDTGSGMDKATQQRIFEPFFTTKERGKGTGLGLSLVFGIMKSHGGFIDLRSEPGKGTTFSCYFPARHDSDFIERKAIRTAEDVRGGTETILLIEDEESLRELIGGLLQTKGYTVLKAADGEEALELYRQHREKIRLVLSDMGLPVLGGRELYQKLKELNPGLRMIFASGFVEPGLRRQLLADGVREFIPKPYHPNEVLRAIREALEDNSPPGVLKKNGDSGTGV